MVRDIMESCGPLAPLREHQLGIVSVLTNAQGEASVELAASYAPGDNFRIIATTDQSALVTLIPNYVNPPTTGAFSVKGGTASEQLAVWRRLHVERGGWPARPWATASPERGRNCAGRLRLSN